MSTPANTSKIGAIYEALGKLVQNPKSFGLPEHLPTRVLNLINNAREILLEDAGKLTSGEDKDLSEELSQDSDTQHGSPEEEQKVMPFNRLLCLRMGQLHLSTHEVAVILGCTIQYVSDLRQGIKAPTELHIIELALLLGVTRETLRTALNQQSDALAAAV
jgi:plasmid maintenance system antidote protein VapI